MSFELQPIHLRNEKVILQPLQASDFERLYRVASDPLLWANHPNKNRYQPEVFQNFFKGALESGGAFIILDAPHGEPIGSSRFYDYDPKEKSVLIGYTFFARNCWGQGYNRAVKELMLAHAFQWVDRVIFHVGAVNIPSQKAMTKLGATKTGELEVAYYGEADKLNFVYEISRETLLK
jgi:RimJ/RimL family protein N-acetyltransferase